MPVAPLAFGLPVALVLASKGSYNPKNVVGTIVV
jgi:hypothetical protein